ncbi:MAG: ABC transporter ATP-binding protein, partial [Bacillota bacterium]
MSEWVGPVISCHEISKFYAVGDGLFALRDVDLEVEKGQFVVLMGPSGSGKSTLLNILGGIDRPSHGEVILKGRKFSRLSEDDLAIMRRTEIGMVFQFFNLLPELTAVENIGFP